MENWRELFKERFVIEENVREQYLRKYDHRTIVEELEHFIEQEIEKAREEGKREALEQIQRFVEDEMLVITRDGTDILEKYIKEWLSKLTTNG